MFWYLLQIIVILWITYIYKTSLAPHETLGHILLFAIMVAYLITFILTRSFNLLLTLLWLLKNTFYRIRPPQRHDGIHRLRGDTRPPRLHGG